MANNSKVHIKHESPEQGITINVFGDTPEEAMQLLVDTMAHVEGNTPNDPASSPYPPRRPSQPNPQRQPRGNGSGGNVNRPVCKQCGSSDALDEVQFTNQDTGQLMTRFKCQTCRIWVGKAF